MKSVSRSRWPDGNFKHLDSVREDGFEVRTSSLSEVARSRVRSPWQDAKQPRAQACIGQELLAVNGDYDGPFRDYPETVHIPVGLDHHDLRTRMAPWIDVKAFDVDP